MTILVIEDEQEIRENIIETLQLNGYDAQGARNGEIGVQLARRINPDLVICDIMMDGMDGYGVLQTLRGDVLTTTLPFIFVTARADREDMRQGMGLGADDYITKPFTSSELVGAVESRLTRQQHMIESSEGRLESARENLVQMVVHRMRAPMEGINSILEIISRQLRQLSPSDIQHMIDTARQGGHHLNYMIEQLTLIARLDTGLLTPESVTVRGKPMLLRDIRTQAINRARMAIAYEPNVDIHLNEQNRRAIVRCDVEALQQAVAEIIAYGLAHSPANGVIVVSQWSDAGFAWFSVENQAASAMPSDYPEGNVGLEVARRVIAVHGGGMKVISDSEKGAFIKAWLPMCH